MTGRVEERLIPLTQGQQAIWGLQRLHGRAGAYNVNHAWILPGDFDTARLREALYLLAARHPFWRALFEEGDGEPRARVLDEPIGLFQEIEAGEWSEQELSQRLAQECTHGFDLERETPVRFKLFRRQNPVLFMQEQHLATDLWSLMRLMGELRRIYEALSRGEIPELPPPKMSHSAFAAAQAALLAGPRGERMRRFWLERMAGELPRLELATDFPRPASLGYHGAFLHFELPQPLSRRVTEWADQESLYPAVVYLAAFYALLQRYTRQEDLIVGIATPGRTAAYADLVGYFVSPVAVRSTLNPREGFAPFVRTLLRQFLDAVRQADYPLANLVADLGGARDPSRSPIFQAQFLWEEPNHFAEKTLIRLGENGREIWDFGPHRWERIPVKTQIDLFDITLKVVRLGDRDYAELDYHTELFSQDAMQRFASHYRTLLAEALADPLCPLERLPLLSEQEQAQLSAWNATYKPYPADQTVHGLFEASVRRYPERIALEFGGLHLSYAALDQQANQLAERLRQLGIAPGVVAAVMLERSFDMPIALFAILKAGGAYLPIDPHLPKERIAHTLHDSGAPVLLTHQRWHERAEGYRGCFLDLEIPSSWSQAAPAKPAPDSPLNPPRPAISTDPAYVIYTSGSTGQPKGAVIEHHSVVNRILWMHQTYGLAPDEAILQKTPFTFDVSVWELFWWSWTGSRLVLAPPGAEKDPETLCGLIQRHQIRVLHFVPSMLSAFLSYLDTLSAQQRLQLAGLRLVFASGEALTPRQVADFRRLLGAPESGIGAQLHNLYGPTEATVDVSYFDCNSPALSRIPIGRPIDNTQLHILNPALQPQPIGAPGELFIAGVGLARGYLNRPQLTAQRFLDNPFQPGTKMYATGDLARFLPDGNIEFLGRLDYQVKIRGYRIELGEIENRLLQHPLVEQALVLARNDNGEPQLVAYYQAPPELDSAQLRPFLQLSLPDYMLPAHFVRLDQFPLGPTGKTDRKALPPPRPQGDAHLEPPADPLEAQLLQIWQQVLGSQAIGVLDNFYLIGGHSLKAIHLGTRIQRELQVCIPLAQLLERPTVRDMRRLIGQHHQPDASSDSLAAIPPAPPAPDYPLSPAQQRLFILQQLGEAQSDPAAKLLYNMPEALLLQGPLQPQRLEDALRTLIQRHPILRTGFQLHQGQPRQFIHPDPFFHLSVRQLPEAWLQDHLAQFTQPFDLAIPPLLRAELVLLAPDRQVLLLDLHHIITDEISKSLLASELSQLLSGQQLLPAPHLQYQDYAHWQSQLLQSASSEPSQNSTTEHHHEPHLQALQLGIRHWSNLFKEPLPLLQLETEFPPPAIPSSRGQSFTFHLDSQLSQQIPALAARLETTPFTLLLALFQIQLSFLSGQEDLCVGTPVIGRPPQFQNQQGLFVNTLALRGKPAAHKSFASFVQELHRSLLAAIQHQHVPFDLVVQLARQNNPAATATNPLFDAFFVLQNQVFQLQVPRLQSTNLGVPLPAAKFDLLLGGLHSQGIFGFSYQYRCDLWSEGRIARLADQFRHLLRQVLDDPLNHIGRLQKVTDAEGERLTHDFNDTALPFDHGQTIGARFSQVAAQFPHKAALVWRQETLTYAQLDTDSNRLAHAIRASGVSRGAIVAILSHREPLMVLSLLAVLKAGAAYLPLDPDHPPQRLAQLCQQANASLLLVNQSLLAQLTLQPNLFPPLLHPDLVLRENWPLTPVLLDGHGDDLAYLIFTSGSTGQPKGVMIRHRNVLNLRLFFQHGFYRVQPSDVSIQFAPFTFDASAGEIFMSLLNGCTLHILSGEIIGNFTAFENYLTQQAVSFAALPPAYLTHLKPQNLPRLRILMSAGSAPGPELMARWAGRLAFVNAYGPTETTIISTAWTSGGQPWPGGRVPIGKPVFNTRVYILDAFLRLQPIGVTGELCIAGDGLASGYLDMPEATDAAFIPNPHQPGEIIYRTGDLARWRIDGNLEFIGRRDDQIKIRGHRIELGEITRILEESPLVAQGAVIDLDDPDGQKSLCAYFVAKNHGEVNEKLDQQLHSLRDYLAQRLPAYMLPAAFIPLAQLPLTPNGKLDRKALPLPQAPASQHQPPRDPLETQLAQIWARILDRPAVGIHDDFFQLGGQSLKAIQLASAISQTLGLQLNLVDIFQSPTIDSLAQRLRIGGQRTRQIPHAEARPFYPLAPPQRRIHLLEKLEGPGSHYLIPALFQIRGNFQPERLPRAIRLLLDTQEALRSSFHDSDEGPLFRIHDHIPDSAVLFQTPIPGKQALIQAAMAPFQLHQAPLWRIQLGSDDQGTPLLMLVIHHLIADGWSLERLITQLLLAYGGQSLQQPPLRYRDFAVWSSQRLADGQLAHQEAHWLQLFQPPPPPLQLPLDHQRPSEQSFQGARLLFQLDAHRLQALESLATSESATLFTLLLAAQAVLLGKWSNSEDLVIGSPVAGRQAPELQEIVGLFVNTLAFRIQPQRHISPRLLLRQLRQQVLDAFAHQDFPFELLVDRLRLPRHLNRNPLFDTMFILQNRDLPEILVDDTLFQPLDSAYDISKFDLTLEALRHDDQLQFVLTYATSLFKPETAARLSLDYQKVLDAFIQDPDLPIRDILLQHQQPLLLQPLDAASFQDAEFDF